MVAVILLALKETIGINPQFPATHFGQGGAEAVRSLPAFPYTARPPALHPREFLREQPQGTEVGEA